MKKKEPKILIIDIETAPILASVWGLYDQNVGLPMIERDWFIISFSAKWMGNDKIIYKDLRGEDLLADDVDDTKILRHVHYLLNEADIVIAHNGDRFDIKKLKARFILNNLPPIKKLVTIDTLKVARREFAFTSNTLQYLSDKLVDDPELRKQKSKKFQGFTLWRECLRDNIEAWNEMELYNIGDILSLEQLYLKLRPWMSNHPNIALMRGELPDVPTCRKCGSDHMIKRGPRYNSVTVRQEWQCKSCGGYMSTPMLLPDNKEERNIIREKKRNLMGN